MECAHCEQVGATYVYRIADLGDGEWGPYCDILCAKAHKRACIGLDWPKLIAELRESLDDSAEQLKFAEERVAAGQGHLSSRQIMIELQATFLAQGFRVADLDGAVTRNRSNFENMDATAKWFRLEKKITKLQIKVLENILARNKIYLAFKERLMEDWVELLDTCPDDETRQGVAAIMKLFYNFFKMADAYF